MTQESLDESPDAGPAPAPHGLRHAIRKAIHLAKLSRLRARAAKGKATVDLGLWPAVQVIAQDQAIDGRNVTGFSEGSPRLFDTYGVLDNSHFESYVDFGNVQHAAAFLEDVFMALGNATAPSAAELSMVYLRPVVTDSYTVVRVAFTPSVDAYLAFALQSHRISRVAAQQTRTGDHPETMTIPVSLQD